ncbi:hypothetical protein ACFX2G_035158 [Malus domestica]
MSHFDEIQVELTKITITAISEGSTLMVDGNEPKPETKADPNMKSAKSSGMNDVVEVPQPAVANINVSEFGSVAAFADKVTLTGHPIFKDLEP